MKWERSTRKAWLSLSTGRKYTEVTPEQDLPGQTEAVQPANRTIYVFWLHGSILILDLAPSSSIGFTGEQCLLFLSQALGALFQFVQKFPDTS